jgi:hypothetical protein
MMNSEIILLKKENKKPRICNPGFFSEWLEVY